MDEAAREEKEEKEEHKTQINTKEGQISADLLTLMRLSEKIYTTQSEM